VGAEAEQSRQKPCAIGIEDVPPDRNKAGKTG
jgi:hypothetical protein